MLYEVITGLAPKDTQQTSGVSLVELGLRKPITASNSLDEFRGRQLGEFG